MFDHRFELTALYVNLYSKGSFRGSVGPWLGGEPVEPLSGKVGSR